MNDVRLDPQQVPAGAELLLAADLGEHAPGRPIYARPEPDGHGEPAARIKVGAVLTRRMLTSEATETPSGAAYGNPLRGRPGQAPSVPIGAALLARTDTADARGWRVYRVTPTGTVIYDEWIDHHPASGELVVKRLRAAARRSPEAALRRAVDGRGDHPAASGVAAWLANEQTARPGSKKPRSRPRGAGGAAASCAGAVAPERTPGFEPARASAAEPGHFGIVPAAELPARMNG